MGDLNVTSVRNQQEHERFMRFLLKDVKALQRMLKEGWFETDTIRIGAEQEMCIVDNCWKPALLNLEALEAINDPMYTTELARFNMETNLLPLEFKGRSISIMHNNLKSSLEKAQKIIQDKLDISIVLSGILPTIRKFDVELENITPLERYRALMRGLRLLRGDMFELRIKGIDEMNIRQESGMLEACNTSFQVHLQVTPDTFARKYNVAQAMAAPVMAAAVNSPMLFARRLWKETRIALFQQSLDIRTFTQHLRDRSPRVNFGNSWLKESIMEIYQEDIARFKVLLTTEVDEDVFEKMANGITPKLRALNIHNSTVYRWNRPCYGISDNGQPHLRIENRILPAGPSLLDEMANATFWLGLMNGFEDAHGDISKKLDFEDARGNFFAAARFGLDTRFNWIGDKKITPSELILKELLPIAREGLQKATIVKEDIDKYLEVIEKRVATNRTGANWILHSFSTLSREGATKDEVTSTITASIVKNQREGKPVHEWELASIHDLDYEPSNLLVEEFMTTDLVTVQETDLVDLAAQLMDWQKIRHMPVEGPNGSLAGLVTARLILRHLAGRNIDGGGSLGMVKDIMLKSPITVTPEEKIVKALDIMRSKKIGCLPVIKNDQLVGMITEADFLNITQNLLRRLARRKKKK